MPDDKHFHRVLVSRLHCMGKALALAWRRDFDFSPGQLVEVALAEGGPSRLYSLFTGPMDEEAGILFTIVEGGAITPSLARLAAGDELWIRGPSGSFPALAEEGVWIANGTGVAPFMSMARAGLVAGKTLIHGSRGIEDFYFQDELEARMGEGYLRCLSRPIPGAPSQTGLFPGRLTAYLASRDWQGARSYELCGSASMVVEVRDLLIEKGVEHERIISEVYF